LGRRIIDAPAVPNQVIAEYHEHVRALLNLPFDKDASGKICPHVLTLHSDASESLREFENWIEPQLSEFGALGNMSDWGAKVVGAVARIAGLLHMAAMTSGSAQWQTPIAQTTIKQSIQIGKYLIPHARAAFAEMGTDAVVGQANTILRCIEHQNAREFTKRDLHQALRGRFKRVEELDAPLELLCTHGYIARRQELSGGPGRKPSPKFEVNPLWPSRRTDRNCEDSEYCE